MCTSLQRFVKQYHLETAAIAIAFLVISQMLANDLLWDDAFLIKNFGGFDTDSLVQLIQRPFWQNSSFTAAEMPPYWRPVTTSLFWLTSLISGHKSWAFHATSIFALFFCALALYRLLISIYSNRQKEAFWIAALYFIHPITIEVSCMVANVSDHLSLGFLLIAIHSALRFIQTCQNRFLVIVSTTTILSCLSKEFGVLAIGVPIVAYALLKTAKISAPMPLRSILILVGGTLVPVSLFLFLRSHVLQTASEAGIRFFEDAYELPPDLFFLSLGQLLSNGIAPLPMGANIYLSITSPIPWILSSLAVAGLLWSTYWATKRKVTTPWIIFLFLTIPLLGPSLLGVAKHANGYTIPLRYFHLPLVALFAATVPFVHRISTSSLRPFLFFLFLLLGLLSWKRISEWRDEITFFEIEATNHSTVKSDVSNLCEAYIRHMRYADALTTIKEYQESIEAPSSEEQTFILRIFAQLALYQQQDFNEATILIQKALELNPTHLPNVFLLAEIRDRAGRRDQAKMVLNDALKAPWYSEPHRQRIRKQIERYSKKEYERKR